MKDSNIFDDVLFFSGNISESQYFLFKYISVPFRLRSYTVSMPLQNNQMLYRFCGVLVTRLQ